MLFYWKHKMFISISKFWRVQQKFAPYSFHFTFLNYIKELVNFPFQVRKTKFVRISDSQHVPHSQIMLTPWKDLSCIKTANAVRLESFSALLQLWTMSKVLNDRKGESKARYCLSISQCLRHFLSVQFLSRSTEQVCPFGSGGSVHQYHEMKTSKLQHTLGQVVVLHRDQRNNLRRHYAFPALDEVAEGGDFCF